ncbi:glycosyltransferase [Aquicoccus sp. SCR17]|nr:glycosyltransferase [Carideicomes alvinocaridis]
MDITQNNPPPARLLDITRLISRAGRVLTGVDRVEFAYLRELCRSEVAFFALARSAFGYILLDRDGACAALERIRSDDWGEPGTLSRLALRQERDRQAAESRLRELALARCRPTFLGRMLRQHLPEGTAYLNIGHSNISQRVLSAVRTVPGARIAIFLHDTIPLDLPEFQRRGTPERFASLFRRALRNADLLLCNSAVTRDDILRHAGHRAPRIAVAHLGYDPVTPDPAGLPPGLPPDSAYFVILGTIEPRKNHALMLDFWEEMSHSTPPERMPRLLICGTRGWRNESLFRRLDSSPLIGRSVTEHAGLGDAAVAALLQGSAGLLFPSLAEGYGLPPIEAAALGVPVVCNDLPICREVLGDIPIYAKVTDRYLWRRTITGLAERRSAGKTGTTRAGRDFTPPDWSSHFNVVLSMT